MFQPLSYAVFCLRQPPPGVLHTVAGLMKYGPTELSKSVDVPVQPGADAKTMGVPEDEHETRSPISKLGVPLLVATQVSLCTSSGLGTCQVYILAGMMEPSHWYPE